MQAVRTPHEFVNDESVLLVEWLVQDGEQVQKGRSLATIETSKATLDIEAPVGGYVRFYLPKGTEVKVGGVLCFITDSPTDPIPEASENSKGTADVSPPHSPSGALAATATRFSGQAASLIREHGLTEKQFVGKGLVTAQDVLNFVNGQKAPQSQIKSVSDHASVRTEELPRRKRVEARLLLAGQNAASSLVSVICSTRGLKTAAQTHPELRVGPLPLILYEVARLLRKYPILNAFYEEGNAHYYDCVNIGVAIDAGRGLKVPVLMNADHRTIAEIRMEVENFVLAYLDDTLPVHVFAGGTFTVTDLSGEDVSSFVPLINQGQCAILGIGSEYLPPASSEGVFNLILAFDHRLTEGRAAAAFLKDLRDRLASYERALRSSEAESCCSRCLRTATDLAELNVPILLGMGPAGRPEPICANCILGW